MKFSEYTALAMRTCSCETTEDKRVHGAMLIISEMGEIAGIVQKTFQGHDFDALHMQKELGDLLWGLAEINSTYECPPIPDTELGISKESEILNEGELYEAIADLSYFVSMLAHRVVEYRSGYLDEEFAKSLTHTLIDKIEEIAWYCDASLNQIAEMNIEKLKARYPDGFSSTRSLNRVEGDV